MNPSTAQILEAVERCPSEYVVVLPNNKNIVPVARQVDELTDKHVAGRAHAPRCVEALAALVAYDPQAELDDNVDAMARPRERVADRRGHPGRARQRRRVRRRSQRATGSPICRDGISRDRRDAGRRRARRSSPRSSTEDSEIVTVLVGSEARRADTERVREHVALAHPHVEVEVHEGGQPLYPYLIGVE